MVVTISKYRIALPPMRPMVLTLPVPAMPHTSVPNSSGAMIDLISRRKMVAQQAQSFGGPGKCRAERDARHQRDQDPGGQRRTLHLPAPLQLFAQHIEEQHVRAAESG